MGTITLKDLDKQMDINEQEAWHEGKGEGWQEGREEGLEKGAQIGRNEAARTIATRLLGSGKFSPDKIAKFSGLAIEEVKAIQDEMAK